MRSFIRPFALSTFALALAGCIPVPLPPTQERVLPACAAVHFPENEAIGPGTVDKFTGTYLTGRQTLVIRRDGHRLLAEQAGYGTRELNGASVESWTWQDGCGATYDFGVPSEGPSASLMLTDPDGSKTRWQREIISPH
jgi:hypothetical protein